MSRLGTKDLIKIENKSLSPDDYKKVAKIAPDATVNTIKNFKIVDKKQVK